MKIIILLMLFTTIALSQTYNVGQTNANVASALTKALAQPDSNTVYRGLLNALFDSLQALRGEIATKQDAMGVNDNYVTDAEKTVIGNTSGINTGDNATNTQYSGLAASKQDALVAGGNIKNINGSSILGSGNLVVTSDTTGFWAIINDVVQDALAQSDTLLASAETLDSLTIAFWNGTLSGFDSTFVYQQLALKLDSSTYNTFKLTLAGGTTNQALTKIDNTNYNWEWNTIGTIAADTIPDQFTFTDDIDAVLSSYHTDYIIVAGCDSARFYPASGDTIRIGALGTKTVSPRWADVGDTVYTFNVASGTNSTATHSIVYSSDGTPLDTFTVTTVAASGGGAHITDNLELFWNIDSVASGTISEWFDDIVNYRVTPFGGDTANSPAKSGTDVIYDGNDHLRGTTGGGTIPDFTGDPISIYGIVDLQDTTSTALLFGVARTRELTISIASNRICAYAFDGSTSYYSNVYSTAFLGKHVIAATWDGSSDPDIYLDGSLRTDIGGTDGSVIADNRAFMGGDATNNSPNGTSVPLFMVYNVEHNSTQVNQNVDSDTFQDLIP